MIPYLKKIENKLGETSAHLFKTFFVYGFITLSIITFKILIARLYGQEELGIFTYFFSLVSLVFLFTSFGFPEAITQTIVKEPNKLRDALKIASFYLAIFTTFFVIIIFLIDKNIQQYVAAFLAYIIIYTLSYLTYSILRGFKKFAEASFYSLIARILWIIFLLAIFFTSPNINYLLLSLSLGWLGAAIVAFPRIKKLFQKTTENIKINKKRFFYLAFSLFLMQVGFYSLRYIDTISIRYLVDFTSLGLYSAYGSITNTIRLVAYVFPVVLLPMAVISKYKLKKSLEKILTILIPFAAFILLAAHILVPILYGTQYKTTYLPIALVISSTLLVIYAYFNSIFVGENKFSKFYLKIIGFDFFLSLVINTMLNIYFIIKIGIIGAPIATAITIILKIILNSYGIKRLRIKNYGSQTNIVPKPQN
jgi:O-antigen/teichoic acid export membrane protein